VIGFYLTVVIIILMVAYAGVENTRNLFIYINLQLRYFPIKIKMEMMKRKLKRQLDIDRKELMKRITEDAKTN
jgi:hypothetical protein